MKTKNGFLTSEFWITAGIAAVSTYIALDPAQPPKVRIAAIAGAVLKAAYYTSQRTKLKIEPPDGLQPDVVAKGAP